MGARLRGGLQPTSAPACAVTSYSCRRLFGDCTAAAGARQAQQAGLPGMCMCACQAVSRCSGGRLSPAEAPSRRHHAHCHVPEARPESKASAHSAADDLSAWPCSSLLPPSPLALTPTPPPPTSRLERGVPQEHRRGGCQGRLGRRLQVCAGQHGAAPSLWPGAPYPAVHGHAPAAPAAGGLVLDLLPIITGMPARWSSSWTSTAGIRPPISWR
jgi:hypothetical protein